MNSSERRGAALATAVRREVHESAEEDEELWTSWSAPSAAHIFIDGQPLHAILAMIHAQLLALRRHQRQSQEIFITRQEMDMLWAGHSLVSPPSGDCAAPMPSAVTEAKVRRSVVVTHPTAGYDHQILEELKEGVKMVMERQAAVEEKVGSWKQMEVKVTTELKEFEKRLQHLDQVVQTQTLYAIEQDTRIKMLEKSLLQRMDDMNLQQTKQWQDFQHQQTEALQTLQQHYQGIEERLAAQDALLQKQSSQIFANFHHITELQSVLQSYADKHLLPLQQLLQHLEENKANKADLDTKVDVTEFQLKADQTALLQLQSLYEELLRNFHALSEQTQDRLQAMDQRFEQRIDRILQYCLRLLRRELKQSQGIGGGGGGGGGGGDGELTTDIGRVRCLVCNQVSAQLRETDIVFGGPQLPQTLRSRPRSRSPPQTQSPRQGAETASPPRVLSMDVEAEFARLLRPTSASQKKASTTKHSKLVKLSAVPQRQGNALMAAGVGMITDEDTPAVSPKDPRQSVPLLQIYSPQTQQPVHTAVVHGHVVHDQPMTNYKNMEEKYGTKRTAMPSLPSSHRPKSAPQRRSSMTSGKLQALIQQSSPTLT